MNSKLLLSKLNDNSRLFIYISQRFDTSIKSNNLKHNERRSYSSQVVAKSLNKSTNALNSNKTSQNQSLFLKQITENYNRNQQRAYYYGYAFLFGCGLTLIYNQDWFKTNSILLAKEISNQESNNSIQKVENTGDESEEEQQDTDKSKKKSSFRDRKIIQYENRIRHYSTPDKVFRYFATIKIWNERSNDYEVFMTPDDFVRSLTYGIKQPEGLGLDSYNKFDPKTQSLAIKPDENSVFKRMNAQGLIAFSDYIFLVTLLSTPTRHFEIAFHMFDLDGNGNIDMTEFEQLQTIIRNQTSLGQRHRDTRMTGNVLKDNETLNEYFFGHNLDELLTVQKFTDFHKQLQTEVIKMEFDYCRQKEENENTVISEEAFCEIILAYAGFSSSKTKKMLKRIQKIYGPTSKGINFDDYKDFFQVLRSIQDIDTALKFYSIAGAAIDKNILKHVAKTVAGVELSDKVIEVVFNLFDDNGDGKLSQKEFIKVMKKRLTRGLQIPKDTGFIKFIEAFGICTKETFFSAKP